MNCPSLWFLGFSPFEPLLFAFKESSFIVYKLKSALAWYCRQVSIHKLPFKLCLWCVIALIGYCFGFYVSVYNKKKPVVNWLIIDIVCLLSANMVISTAL